MGWGGSGHGGAGGKNGESNGRAGGKPSDRSGGSGKGGKKGATAPGKGKGKSAGGTSSNGFVPRRGGGDWGRRQRQMEQERIKDEKTKREVDYFWHCQEQNVQWDQGKGGPPKKGERRLREEEAELFASHSGSVGIDFRKYDNVPVEVSPNDVGNPDISCFDDLWESFELPDFLWENIERCKYKRPTPIQKHAIPTALLGRDAMCCAQTGSGKTFAFLFPILGLLDPDYSIGSLNETYEGPGSPQALVLAPTRELCSQIHLEAQKLSFRSKFRAIEVYGGVDAKLQLKELARGADLITATPGRLIDFVDRGVLTLSEITFLVLDEADRMLDMGFEPQIREIVEKRDMPIDTRQTLMFSATFPKEIQKLAKSFLWNYVWIAIGVVGAAVDSVQQQFVECTDPDKAQKVVDLLWENKDDTTLVFCAMKRTCAWLENHLKRNGFASAAIHGDMEQREREASLNGFRNGTKTILVATDVAARGLDIPAVSHVVNYDLPSNIDDYVHRIGRTGRIGRRGWATSFYVRQGRRANTNILRDLIKILKGAGQEVPDFLLEEAEWNSWSGGGGKQDRQTFGGRDHRSAEERRGGGKGKGGGGGGGVSAWGIENGRKGKGGGNFSEGAPAWGAENGRKGKGGGGSFSAGASAWGTENGRKGKGKGGSSNGGGGRERWNNW